MVQTKNQSHSSLRARVRHLSNVHFLLVLAIIGQLIIFDTGKLIPPEVVLRRWLAVGLFSAAITAVWYIARNRSGQQATLQKLIGLLIAADIAFASFAVYSQRGMASRAVLLFVIPILVANALERKSALIASSLFSVAAYLTTCVAYFVLNFNEGYKLELYGEAGFYSAVLLLIPYVVWSTIGHSRER